MSLVGDIIRYESGEMTEDEIVVLFQALHDTGLVWSLQGSYQRVLRDLVQAGRVKLKIK